jgi:predicted metal-dependent peptidase
VAGDPRLWSEDRLHANTLGHTRIAAGLAQAAAAEAMKGGPALDVRYGHMIAQRLRDILTIRVPWHKMLQGRLIGELGHEFATWSPPNKRYFPELVMPSHRSRNEDHLLIAMDVSSSITDEIQAKFRGCIIPASKRAKKITVVTFDEAIRERHTGKNAAKLFAAVQMTTGSHTFTSVIDTFTDVFDEINPTAAVILTDGLIRLPDFKSKYRKVHWVLPSFGRKQPWGKNYMMHEAW